MSKATKRPWRQANKHPRHICDARGFKIAKCLIETKGANFKIPVEEAEANAALIVAAVNSYSPSKEEAWEAMEKTITAADAIVEYFIADEHLRTSLDEDETNDFANAIDEYSQSRKSIREALSLATSAERETS